MRMLMMWSLLLVCGLVTVSTAHAARTATVEFYIGDLHYAVAPDTVFARTTLGQALDEGMFLRTGSESRAEVRLDDGTLLRMQENTLIQLYTMVPDTLQAAVTAVGLEQGSLYVIKGRVLTGDEFQVRTPIAVAAIRGTEFMDTFRAGANEVQVLRGEVDFRSLIDGRTIRILRGQAARIKGAFAPALRELTNQELSDLLSASETESFQQEKPPVEPEGGPVEGEGGEGETGEETGKVEAPERYESRTGKAGKSYGASIGAVVIDGQLVNMIGFRPEFTIGKVGIGLDLSLYLDADGDILDRYWDDPQDYIDKIYYLRYAQKGEPFYLRAGALEEVCLGYGLIMRDYSNIMEYPSTIRVGAELGLNRNQFVLEAMFANFRELDEPGVFGGRLAYRPLVMSDLPLLKNLEVGAIAVMDGNQYAALEDGLGEELPDSSYHDRGALVWGLDAGMPLLRGGFVDIDLYAQFAQINEYGHGLTIPGFRASAGPLRAEFEYCIFGKQFVSDYFNRTYDIERARRNPAVPDPYAEKGYITKKDFLEDPQFQESKQGWYGGLGLNLLNLLDIWGSIQLLGSGDTADESGYLEGVLDTSWIPRISHLSAYAQQTHVRDLFEFERGPSTAYGVNLGYEIAPGASIIVGMRGTYADTDGDGVFELVRTTQIETMVTF
ncbi:MAG: FecR domain-containing protein [Candidatus Eisenbacteria sp.]|nr:FecR domain-containing protein [Candidatus Eisenbacteria bacterium]